MASLGHNELTYWLLNVIINLLVYGHTKPEVATWCFFWLEKSWEITSTYVLLIITIMYYLKAAQFLMILSSISNKITLPAQYKTFKKSSTAKETWLTDQQVYCLPTKLCINVPQYTDVNMHHSVSISETNVGLDHIIRSLEHSELTHWPLGHLYKIVDK